MSCQGPLVPPLRQGWCQLPSDLDAKARESTQRLCTGHECGGLACTLSFEQLLPRTHPARAQMGMPPGAEVTKNQHSSLYHGDSKAHVPAGTQAVMWRQQAWVSSLEAVEDLALQAVLDLAAAQHELQHLVDGVLRVLLWVQSMG